MALGRGARARPALGWGAAEHLLCGVPGANSEHRSQPKASKAPLPPRDRRCLGPGIPPQWWCHRGVGRKGQSMAKAHPTPSLPAHPWGQHRGPETPPCCLDRTHQGAWHRTQPLGPCPLWPGQAGSSAAGEGPWGGSGTGNKKENALNKEASLYIVATLTTNLCSPVCHMAVRTAAAGARGWAVPSGYELGEG